MSMHEGVVMTTDNTPNAQSVYQISEQDLPLHCPMDNTTLWNSHPRVYLPIEDSGEARCPYCGALYVLKDED